jgi:hypothetical protein
MRQLMGVFCPAMGVFGFWMGDLRPSIPKERLWVARYCRTVPGIAIAA